MAFIISGKEGSISFQNKSAVFIRYSPILKCPIKNIDTIKKEFKSDWKGCTLTEIYYAGDDCTKDHKDWADRNNADEVIVLLSSFDVDSSGGDGSLNPNSTYSDWKWILVRTDGGKWQHVDHGY